MHRSLESSVVYWRNKKVGGLAATHGCHKVDYVAFFQLRFKTIDEPVVSAVE
jgi:hypothetical protein